MIYAQYILIMLPFRNSIMSSYTIYEEWQSQPVLTTIGTTGLPIEKIKFPAITICGQGSSKDILNNAMFRQLGTYLASQGKNISEMSEEEVSWQITYSHSCSQL